MSKKRKQNKKEEHKLQFNVSDVVKSLQLSEKDMEELNNYLEQYIHKSTSVYLSKIFEDQKLTVSQKLFLSYVRGSADNLGNYIDIQKSENFIDIDAAEEFANSMYNSDITQKIIRHTLGFMSKIMELNIEDIELVLKDTIDEDERKRVIDMIEHIRKNKVPFDESIKEWESEIEVWKQKNSKT